MGGKLLFFDIDGTIAQQNLPPSPATVEAIRRARENGHKTFICTARTACDLYDSVYEAGFDGTIAGAGAYIVVEGKKIFHRCLPRELLLETVKGIWHNHFSGVLEGTDNIYLIPGEVELYGDWPRLSRAEEAKALTGIEKFTIHTRNHEHIKQVVRRMPKLLKDFELYANNNGSFGEFVRKGVDKASGIRRVAAYYGAALGDTVAFGDSMNDACALRAAGVGVAMGDSPKELREAADLVTGTLAEEGVARAMERLGLI